MEIIGPDKRKIGTAQFIYKDVVFFYRTNVTVGDQFALNSAGSSYEGDQIKFKTWDFCLQIVKTFVTGWKGVTLNGKEVPYSFDALMNELPAEIGNDLIMVLGMEIAKNAGLLPKEANGEPTLKNV